MTAVAIEAAQDWARRVLVGAGLAPDDAQVVVANLLFAETRGVASHGLIRLTTYVERIRAGGINPAARFRVEADLGALVVVDADSGPGASIAVRASDLAVERARVHGLGCVVARNASHFGAAGFYANRIADAGLLGVVVCNTESVMCAPAGGRPVLGTNPLAVAVPLPADVRPQLDMATTAASQGKLLAAAQQGESIPPGWAVDETGRPTTSPADGLRGGLLPSGGPKGFGLAFAIDALLAAGGANVSTAVSALHGDPAAPQRLGQLFLALRVDGAIPLEEYRARIASLIDAIHASATSADAPQPLAPGEPELARQRDAGGVLDLPDALLDQLAALAADMGVPLFEPLDAAATG